MVSINRDMLKPGDELAGGKYQIVEEVGSGAMGTVYRAFHTVLERQVAIKVLNPVLISVSNAKARFLREAKAASKIQHRNSVHILDYGSEGEWLYIVMEFLEGMELKDIIEKEAPLHKTRLAEIMTQVCSALSAAHDVGVIHRDLKPANIMVVSERDDDGNEIQAVKVCDFGIAKVQTTSEDSSGDSLDLTATGMITGTPAYMSPEQAKGKKLDARSDLYSCGVLMYIMATQELPFHADSPLGYLTQHVSDVPPAPSISNPSVSKALEAIIQKCLNKEPRSRYQNAKALRQDLLALESSSSSEELRIETGIQEQQEQNEQNDWTWGTPGFPLPDDRENSPTTKTIKTEVVPASAKRRPWMVVAGFVLVLVVGSFFFLSTRGVDSEDEETDTSSEKVKPRSKRSRFPSVPATSSSAARNPHGVPLAPESGENEIEEFRPSVSDKKDRKKTPPKGRLSGEGVAAGENGVDEPAPQEISETLYDEESEDHFPDESSGEPQQRDRFEDTETPDSPTDLPDKEPIDDPLIEAEH